METGFVVLSEFGENMTQMEVLDTVILYMLAVVS